jgi:hypothetical protein
MSGYAADILPEETENLETVLIKKPFSVQDLLKKIEHHIGVNTPSRD